MNPLRYFYVPLLMLVSLALVATSQDGQSYSWTIVPPILALAAVYSLGPQIKWWYWRRYPPDLDTRFAPLLENFAFYEGLDHTGKREFRRRTFLFQQSIDFKGQALPKVPVDIQVMIAASAATVSYGRKDVRYDDLTNVVCYPHPFPSPEFKELHLSELYQDDGVLIFSLPDLVQSVVEATNFLQLGLYEWARAYELYYSGVKLPALSWEQIEAVSRFKEAATHKWHGLADLDRAALTTVLYFTHSKSFNKQFPDLFQAVAEQLQLS